MLKAQPTPTMPFDPAHRRLTGHACFILAGCLACGCAAEPDILSDHRPPANPAPTDVQAEMRDARFFLPIPDPTIGPSAEMQPQMRRQSAASQ